MISMHKVPQVSQPISWVRRLPLQLCHEYMSQDRQHTCEQLPQRKDHGLGLQGKGYKERVLMNIHE